MVKVDLYNEDCISGMRARLADNSVRHVVTSIPFGALFSYSHKPEDIGNCRDGVEFVGTQFGLNLRFWLEQVARVLSPGCVAAIHIQQLDTTQVQHGHQGIRDFRGAIIDIGRKHGLQPHGEVAIPKNPQRIAQVRKLHRLLFVTGRKDSRLLAPANNDFVLFFKKPGDDGRPVRGLYDKKLNPRGQFTQEDWIKWAHGVWADAWADESALLELEGYRDVRDAYLQQQWRSDPIWADIIETDVLDGHRGARESDEEKHVCLARDSRVLTRQRGYVPIQEVAVGDEVLTHRGRWQPVLAVQNTGVRPVVTVRAQGVPGLTLTPDHKLWARVPSWTRARQGAERAAPGWLPADAAVPAYVNLKIPDVEPPSLRDPQSWWIVGRWLADGHWDARGGLHISCGRRELPSLLSALGSRAGAQRTTFSGHQVRLRDRGGRLREVLRRCGRGAAGKHLPPEAFTLPVEQAEALLRGYLSGDGHIVPERRRWMASSISRDLLLGMAILVQRVHGAIASVYAGRPARQATIEGRPVECRQDWILSFDIPGGRRSRPFVLQDGAWKRVRSVEDAGEVETWNLRVAEDESYTAEGCIVKNCPLQLEVIRRSLLLYTNPGDLVVDPFMGIGSTAYVCVELGRDVVGFELKESYHAMSMRNAAKAREKFERPDADDAGQAALSFEAAS